MALGFVNGIAQRDEAILWDFPFVRIHMGRRDAAILILAVGNRGLHFTSPTAIHGLPLRGNGLGLALPILTAPFQKSFSLIGKAEPESNSASRVSTSISIFNGSNSAGKRSNKSSAIFLRLIGGSFGASGWTSEEAGVLLKIQTPYPFESNQAGAVKDHGHGATNLTLRLIHPPGN